MVILELREDGTCLFTIDYESHELEWSVEGDTLTLTYEGESIECAIRNGVIILEFDGEVMELSKPQPEREPVDVPIPGTYRLKSFAGFSVELFAMMMELDVEEAKDYFVLELDEDGEGRLIVEEESLEIAWTVDGDTLTISAEGEDLAGTIKYGIITFDMDGIEIKLSK